MATFLEEVERRRLEALARIRRVPIAALIWGPNAGAGTPQAQARVDLQAALTADGHLASFSEDLYDATCGLSNLAQQAAQAEAYDIVFSIPGTPGSLAEIHDFARIPGISHKIVAFLDTAWSGGYANQSLVQMQCTTTCQVQLYQAHQLPSQVIDTSRDLVRRLQEYYYLAGRR